MKINTPLFTLQIDFLFVITIMLVFLSSEIRTLLTPFFVCYLFIVFHELSHMLVASICGKYIDTFSVSIAGVSIHFKQEKYCTLPLKKGRRQALKEVCIYVAGPISNFLLAFLFYRVPMIFQVNLFLGLLNLLPIYPLDGYHILQHLLRLFRVPSSHQDIVIAYINYLFFGMLLSFAIIQILVYHTISIFIFVAYLFVIRMGQKSEEKLRKKLSLS